MKTGKFRGAAFALNRTSEAFILVLISLCASSCSERPGYSGNSDKKSTTPSTQARSESATIATQEVSSTPNPTATPQQTPTTVAQATAYGTCQQPCTGTSKVFFNSEYSKWIKVVLCSPSRYDILIGENQQGPFYKVGDTGGHGQDHCELVNPNFAELSSDDDVTSGNCPTCNVSSAGSVTNLPEFFGKNIYHRSKMNNPFTFSAADRWGIHTSCWYECGVSF